MRSDTLKIGDRVVITWGSRTLSGRIDEASSRAITLLVRLDEPLLFPKAVITADTLPLIREHDGYHIIGAGWDSVTVELNDRSKPMKIEHKTVQVDLSGQGHAWTDATNDTCPANLQAEIAEQIIDGHRETCEDYIASNGLHYRWS